MRTPGLNTLAALLRPDLLHRIAIYDLSLEIAEVTDLRFTAVCRIPTARRDIRIRRCFVDFVGDDVERRSRIGAVLHHGIPNVLSVVSVRLMVANKTVGGVVC